MQYDDVMEGSWADWEGVDDEVQIRLKSRQCQEPSLSHSHSHTHTVTKVPMKVLEFT